MSNLFAGLSSGNTSLLYYRRGIETAGHNIANASTDGYSRQRVNVTENPSLSVGNGISLGQGVSIDSITRVRNEFLDAQFRAQLPTLGYWETRVDAINTLEYYSGQVAANNLGTAIDTFWTKLQDVSGYPDTSVYRQTLYNSAQTMVSSLQGIRTQYDAYRNDINGQIYNMVEEANGLIDDIALICNDIYEAQAKGENPNDLLDERDRMADRLCKLTGATVSSPALDEADGDYKIDLHGKYLVQGGAEFNCKGTGIKNTRHLVLVPMVGNNSYYDVQVEYDQFDHSSDYGVASVIMERQAVMPSCVNPKDAHELFVERLANGKTWQVGGAAGALDGGERLDTIYNKNQALGLNGSFSLQVGTVGVQASSNSFATTNGVILGEPAGTDPTVYEFRIAAGEFENTVKIEYNSTSDCWEVYADGGETLLLDTSGNADPKNLTVDDLQQALNVYPQLKTTYDASAQRFTIEAANTEEMRGHLLSITDTRGTLASDLGIANKNPAVEITVTKEDTLTTIANKINAAYMSDLVSGENAAYATNPPGTAPSSPEEWLHANIITEPNGSMYIALTSNVSGEANRINVLPGSVCGANGDFSIARLLGFTNAGSDSTSYMQLNTDPAASTTITKGDVYVDDAYFIYNGVHYLSESNSFSEARAFKTTNSQGTVLQWNNPAADVLGDFAKGVRLNLNGVNHFYDAEGSLSGNEATIITVSSHLKTGSIYALLESRDDMILGLEDYLDRLAYEMVTEVNAIHYASHGSGDNKDLTGTAFFKEISSLYGASRAIRVNAALEKDTSLIAAASDDGTGHTKGEGDGSRALMMAQLKTSKVFNSGTDDFNTYFQSFVADYGSQGYEANYMLEAQQSINDQIARERDSVMGVSTDEEMIDIIKFQQGIGAISRYMTALDDMLDRIINGMGRAGI